MLLSHSLDHGVLVITVHHDDPGIGGRAALPARLEGLVHAYRPAPVVLSLEEPAVDTAAVSTVLGLHRVCRQLGMLMSVVSGSAPARRALEARAATIGTRLVVHARTSTAMAAAFAVVA
ncbi:hypothetical protein [Streptomyces sp. NPDC005017]|uniref:hypothetical protein n=1 Tax=Streptomyces sp. NPDC005017 TaxID=3364706 RepID=UPI00369A8B3E